MASSIALLSRCTISRPMTATFAGRSLAALSQVRYQSSKQVTFEDGKSKWVGLTNDQDFFNKNEKMQRPMSPHLTVYKFPLPAILSISHRGTGVALTGAICAAGIGLMFHPLAYYVAVIQGLGLPSAVFTAAKFTLAFPFTYHTANGIRHLVWDTAKGLGLGSIYTSGYVTVGLAAISAFGLTLL
eukprot:TRINITY_DN4371_c0_g1_i1.p1 TRINITY_DN4371_c0_g1~~TRINITY_DN4371_c0_g1_i1.p1  ORF type:complete len:192 (+),score=29.91 TRINITY_DN4371_c0_g1_i1:23-577(+)